MNSTISENNGRRKSAPAPKAALHPRAARVLRKVPRHQSAQVRDQNETLPQRVQAKGEHIILQAKEEFLIQQGDKTSPTPGVDNIYKTKYFPPSSVGNKSKAAIVNPSSTSPTMPNPAHHLLETSPPPLLRQSPFPALYP